MWNDKQNILITVNRSLSSKYVFHTICDIGSSFYSELKEEYNVYFLTQYGSVKNIYRLFNKENRSVFFDEVILLNDSIKSLDYKAAKDWNEIYENIEIDFLQKFERVIEIGSAISEGAFLKRQKINREKLFNSTAQFKYLSVRKIKETLMFTIKVAEKNNVPIEHYIIDPQELDYNDIGVPSKRHFPYSSNVANFERHDAFLNYYKKNSQSHQKTIDFVFGYTILTEDRVNNMYEILVDKLKSKNIRLFLRDKYNDIDTFIKKDDYLNLVKESKFTLIIPAYDTKTFSAFRYIESIYSDCLPLILDTNYLEEVRESLYIPDDIIVNLNNIEEKINQLDYKKILKEIKKNL